MESLKELEKWRDDPKNWVGSNSSESVNCIFLLENLLDNLFHPTDQWSIVLEFLGVGRSDFYQDPCESCKCECDKRVHCLSENGIGIGCININVNDNVLLNRKTVHINHFLWSFGSSCKHFYNIVKKYKQKKELTQLYPQLLDILQVDLFSHTLLSLF